MSQHESYTHNYMFGVSMCGTVGQVKSRKKNKQVMLRLGLATPKANLDGQEWVVRESAPLNPQSLAPPQRKTKVFICPRYC